jgi:hypothetical protein
MTWISNFIIDKLIIAKVREDNCLIHGNSFDLGDVRNSIPLFDFWSNFFWTNRNVGYNFNYMFHEISNKDLVWSITLFGHLIGWRDGTVVNGIQTYNFEIWYNTRYNF